MNRKMSLLEKEIVNAILKCNKEHHMIDVLYEQYNVASVKNRTFTGEGFYTEFNIEDANEIAKLELEFQLGGIYAEIEGLECGAGFILYVKNGIISTLEGYSYGEHWPNDAKLKKIFTVQNDGSLVDFDI